MAEIEFNILAKRVLRRRIPDAQRDTYDQMETEGGVHFEDSLFNRVFDLDDSNPQGRNLTFSLVVKSLGAGIGF